MSKKMVARLGLVSFIPFCLALMAGFEQSAKPRARSFLPTKADLQNLGFSEWNPPWELKPQEESYATLVRKYPSEEAYFAASPLAKLSAGSATDFSQMGSIPDEYIEQMKSSLQGRLKALGEKNITPFVPFPTPQQRIDLDILDLVKQEKFTKQAFIDTYRKRLSPLESAAEISFAKITPPAAGEPRFAARAGRIDIRVYLYTPAYVREHPAEFKYSDQDTAYFKQRLSDFYRNVAELLPAKKGEEMEEELQTRLQVPTEKRQEFERKKIADLQDGLEALDLLQNSPPKIDSTMVSFGDQGLVVRAVYTFPESSRDKLAKAETEVSTMISASLKQGSAVAQVELTTNSNADYSEDTFRKLLELLAQKLQPFRQ